MWQKDFANVIKDLEMGQSIMDFPSGTNVIKRVLISEEGEAGGSGTTCAQKQNQRAEEGATGQ